MATNTVLFVALPISVAIFGLLARMGFDMKREGKFREMWGYFSWSLVPFAVVGLMWASQGDIADMTRNIVLGVIGAALGATALIWGGYLIQGRTPILKQETVAPNPPNTIGDIRNNSGIITQGQKGDNPQ